MNQRATLLTAALLGALAISLGAFGAHALNAMLTSNGRADTFQLAVRYHFYHVIALLAVGILMDKYPGLRSSAILFTIGILIFSGSLYILALTNKTYWGAVTPFGGLFLLAGWVFSAWVFYRQPMK